MNKLTTKEQATAVRKAANKQSREEQKIDNQAHKISKPFSFVNIYNKNYSIVDTIPVSLGALSHVRMALAAR